MGAAHAAKPKAAAKVQAPNLADRSMESTP
jgi:hypothetical protein